MSFFGWRERPWSLAAVRPPWGERPSIHDHIRSHLKPDGSGLDEEGRDLPDEAGPGKGIRWAPGAMDGVSGHHGVARLKDRARQVHRGIQVVTEDPSDLKIAKLYELLKGEAALQFVDHLLTALTGDSRLNVSRARALALWIARKAPDREPIKIAMAILGVAQDEDGEARTVLHTLGSHDEFTLYAAVAFHGESGAEHDLFALAKVVSGWGRIQVVERLAKTKDPAIKRWLLREGYKNTVMYEYLAHVCATAGDLKRELAAEEVDTLLLKGAGDLIRALIAGAPGPGISAYKDGPEVIERYLHHLGAAPTELEQLGAILAIRRFLEDDESAGTMNTGLRARLRIQCNNLRALPQWEGRIQQALASDVRQDVFEATQAAEDLGLDTWALHFQRLVEGDDRWYQAVNTDDSDRSGQVVALAEARFDLEAIGSGPGSETWSPHMGFEFVVQRLDHFPGLGWPLVRAALRSPTIRQRNVAARVLGAWPRERWPAEAAVRLKDAIAQEPEDEVRVRMERVAAGQSLKSPDD